MVKPDKRKIDMLKHEDKELAHMPDLKAEDAKLKRGESFLRRPLRRKKVKVAKETIHHPKEMRLKKRKK